MPDLLTQMRINKEGVGQHYMRLYGVIKVMKLA
jgi:hypothetical protein